MKLPFDAEQAFTLLAAMVAAVFAWAELKFDVRDYKRRTEELETKVRTLEVAAEAARLLKQSVDTLSGKVEALGTDMKAHGEQTKTLSDAVLRLTTTMEMQDPHPGRR